MGGQTISNSMAELSVVESVESRGETTGGNGTVDLDSLA